MQPPHAQASIAGWQEGASIRATWNGDFGSSSFMQSVDNLAATHANYVSLVFNLYQSNLYSTDIQTGGDTPTDQSLASAIDYIHSKGMKVMIKPHLESYTGDWRAYINPSDRNGWFTNYGNFIIHYAQIAQAHGAEDICLGTELIDMSTASANGSNTQNWKTLIEKVRGVYSGKLTYSANWGSGGFADEKNNIQFWDSLDYIGISAYFNLYSDNSVSGLESAWDSINRNDITPLSQRWNKPVVFTEIGYKSSGGSHTQPWDYSYGSGYDGTEQANDYTALFDYWSRQSNMAGVQLWEWKSDPNAGWPGNTDYTPQHKPAQDVMTQWFGGSGSPNPPPTGNAAFTATATTNPANASAGQNVAITTSVTDTGGQAAGIIVDVEVYNNSNQRVFQQVFNNQTFAGGQTQTLQSNWTLPSAGIYTVKVGVFNYNWSQLYVWNDNAAKINSSGGTTTPPPPSGSTIDIWWPTNGATVSGSSVPFKGLLQNTDVSAYTMYWQVDGGGLVNMPTNNTDYPHKEFDTDVTNWNWRGNGPYTLNFVAKDKSGNILAQKPVTIYVSH